MQQDYIGVNILQALQSILESWVLPKNKLVYIATHKSSTAIEILKWNSFICFSHNLHLGITNFMKDIDDVWITRAFSVVHKIINTFVQSWKKIES